MSSDFFVPSLPFLLHGSSHDRTFPHAVAVEKAILILLGEWTGLEDGNEDASEYADAPFQFRLPIQRGRIVVSANEMRVPSERNAGTFRFFLRDFQACQICCHLQIWPG